MSVGFLAEGTFQAVMTAAGWRCECTGECGRAHAGSGYRCPTVDAPMHGPRRLLVSTTDPRKGVEQGARADRDDLMAWCVSCTQHATGYARRAAAESAAGAQPDLFGGDAA